MKIKETNLLGTLWKASLPVTVAIGLAIAGIALRAWADSPAYVSFSGPAGTTSSTLIIPADPVLQTRIVQLVGSSDTNAGAFSLRSGVGAYAVSANNAAGTAVTVSQTNGLATSDILIIATANGSNFSTTISSFASSTGLVLAASCQGTTNGDSVYKLGSASTLGIGITTNKTYSGEAIYVGQKGRPIRIVVNGNSWAQVDLVTARQE